MRIVCPNCQATYDVPESLLRGTPRRVRCARCGGEWVPEAAPAPEPEMPALAVLPDPPPSAATVQDDGVDDVLPPAIPPPPSPIPAAGREPVAPARLVPTPPGKPPQQNSPGRAGRRGTMVTALLAWAVSLALLAALAWAAFVWRDEVMAAWTPSKRLYALLGLL